MKKISLPSFERPSTMVTKPRSNREMLIEQIVEQTIGTPEKKKQLAKLLALTANTAKWTETDLHALLKKRQDSTIKNYTAFVWWNCKIKKSNA